MIRSDEKPGLLEVSDQALFYLVLCVVFVSGLITGVILGAWLW